MRNEANHQTLPAITYERRGRRRSGLLEPLEIRERAPKAMSHGDFVTA
jgi:hypothetical protein